MDQTSQYFGVPPFVKNTLLKVKFVDLSFVGSTTSFARHVDSLDFWFEKCAYHKMDGRILSKWKSVIQCKSNGEMWHTMFRDMCKRRDFSGAFKSPINWLLTHIYPDDRESIIAAQKVFAINSCDLYQWMVEEFDNIAFFSPTGIQISNRLVVELQDKSVRYHFDVIENCAKLFKIEWMCRCDAQCSIPLVTRHFRKKQDGGILLSKLLRKFSISQDF